MQTPIRLLSLLLLLPGLALAQVINPDVTQDNISQTICTSGWTATVRPSSGYTSRIKSDLLADFEGRAEEYFATE